MAQPNLGRLAEAFQNATNEIVLLGNLPAIHDRQAAQNNHQELVGLIQNLVTRFDTLETRFDTLETRFDTLETRFGALETRFGALETRMTVNDHNSMARSLNASVNSANIQLSLLKTPDNQNVVGFPDNLHALNNLNGAQIDRLLHVFALPANGNLDMKKRRFQSFIGVPWGI